MNRKRTHPARRWTPILVGCGLLVLFALGVSVVYYSSPYVATDAVVVRLTDKTLSSTTSDDELQSISSNLYAALDQVVFGRHDTHPESILAKVGRAVVQEVRGQLLAEASRRLASREGVHLALYGWQTISDRRVAVQRQYLEFPGLFSIVLIDATDGTALSELVFVRTGFGDWALVAVRPHWMRNQGPVVLRQIVQAGIQKLNQQGQVTGKP